MLRKHKDYDYNSELGGLNLRILFTCDSLIGRGAEKLLNDMLPLLKLNCDCELLILTDENAKYLDSLKQKGIQISIIPNDCRGHIKKIFYIMDFIKKGNYDIVHVNLFPFFYYCSIAKKVCNGNFPKLVMTEHNTDNRRRHIQFLRPIEKWIYSSYNAVISINDETQDSLLKWLKPKNKAPFHVVNNGVPINIFLKAERYNRLDLFDGIKDSDILLCMVGAFTEQKNHEMMLNIMLKLPERYKLILIGEGVLEYEIKEKSIKLGIDNRIRFMGFRNDVERLMKTSDIIVIPSKWEGFGLVAVEGMACGKPVVASNVTGLSNVVGDGGIKASSIDTFVEAILSLEDGDVYDCYSTNAVCQSKKFGIEKTVDEYLMIYKQLI